MLETFFKENQTLVHNSELKFKKFINICELICKHTPKQKNALFTATKLSFLQNKNYEKKYLKKNLKFENISYDPDWTWVTVYFETLNCKKQSQLYIINLYFRNTSYEFDITTVFPSVNKKLIYNSREKFFFLTSFDQRINLKNLLN